MSEFASTNYDDIESSFDDGHEVDDDREFNRDSYDEYIGILHKNPESNEDIDEEEFTGYVRLAIASFHDEKVDINQTGDSIHKRSKILFPVSLSANQRKIVHEIAGEFGLESRSFGTEPIRQVRVYCLEDEADNIPENEVSFHDILSLGYNHESSYPGGIEEENDDDDTGLETGLEIEKDKQYHTEPVTSTSGVSQWQYELKQTREHSHGDVLSEVPSTITSSTIINRRRNIRRGTSTNTSKGTTKSTNRRWSVDRAKEWYSSLPWLVGCNYIPSTAINQLEMWQNKTFDPATIEQETALAENLGFNVFRVYLHDLLWTESIRSQFLQNIDQFLNITYRHNIRVIFVLFDDCHRTKPIKLGRQKLPIKGVHNSGWVQSPGSDIVENFHKKENYGKEYTRLSEYVIGILSYFHNDERILMWDIYNEPGQNGLGNKSFELLQCVWKWAYQVRPSQPLTACMDGSIGDRNIAINKDMSDIITFHWYMGSSLETRIRARVNGAQGRPVLCTEYMARELGTTFQISLPLFKTFSIGAISWGLVAGKTQTIFNWGTVNNIDRLRESKQFLLPNEPYPEPRGPWFHDIFRRDGSAYDEAEVEFIRNYTGIR